MKIIYSLLKLGLCLCLASSLPVISQSAYALPFRSDLNRGNDQYKQGNYPQAGQIYNNILEKKANDQKAKFNLGDSLYKEGKYKESQKVFESLTGASVPKDLRQSAYYNMGNSFFKQEDYKSAISAYEETLKIDPKDKDAQFNLELAKKMLAMPKQEKEKKENEQKKKDENKKNEQKKQPVDKSGDKDKENKQKQQKESEQIKPGQMSKEDALRILNALEDNEKHKAQKMKTGQGTADVKDW